MKAQDLPLFLPSPLICGRGVHKLDETQLCSSVFLRSPQTGSLGEEGLKTALTHIDRCMWTQTMKNSIRSEGEQTRQKTKSHFYVTFQQFTSDIPIKNNQTFNHIHENGIVSDDHLMIRM